MKTHKLKQQFLNKLILFPKASRGQISIMFALLLIPIVGFIGGVLDFSQKISYENKLQSTLDSVSIAVAKEIARNNTAKDADLKKIGDIIFKTNHILPDNITASPYVILRDKETLTVSQTASLKTSFMALVGVSKLEIEITSKINIKRSDVELAMILDMSGSMRGSKMSDLKIATKDLVNTLIQDTTGLASVKISYIPWTRGVLINNPMNKQVLKNNYSGKYNCGGSRKKPTEKSPAKQPISASLDKWGYQESCPQTSIVPLTDNKTVLLSAVNGWVADGGTYSDTGLTWGWGTLSPAWNGLWSTTAAAKPYEKVKKFVVLMTDGDNNTTQADTRSKALCKKMKAKGIKIYSIAFKAGKNAQKLLKNCASTLAMYIDASSGDALKEAFKQIADEVGAFYISG